MTCRCGGRLPSCPIGTSSSSPRADLTLLPDTPDRPRPADRALALQLVGDHCALRRQRCRQELDSAILRAGVALALFRQAAAEERVTLQLPRALAAYLDRARRNPALRFEPAG
jgi:hypothetical protein